MPQQSSQPTLLPTLAQQTLPRHVRDLLVLSLKIATNALEGNVALAIKDLEQQLMRESDMAIEVPARERLRDALHAVEFARADLVVNFLNALEAELAMLRAPQVVRGQMTTSYRKGDLLTLVNDQEIEETSALTDAATRAELQNSLQLFLLGQRFGVLAGRPAFDAETLPVGPQALCRSIRRAVERINLNVNVRLMLYRAFERQVMRDYGSMVELMNRDLARNGVLPNLQYVPVRARRTEQKVGARGSDLGDHRLALEAGAAASPGAGSSGTGVAGGGGEAGMVDSRSPDAAPRGTLADRTDPRSLKPAAEARADASRQAAQLLMAMAATQGGALASDQGYTVLRQLLGGRRQLLGKLNAVRSREAGESPFVVSSVDLQETLRSMQMRPPAPVMVHGKSTARTVGHLKQDMLALLRRAAPSQETPPALADEHNDALDLVAMLYDNLYRDLKPTSTASTLLTKLQVPMMRVALQDQTFFTRQDHPARQMLNAIAETGANWGSEDEADPHLVSQMHSIVDRAVQEYRGDPGIFQAVLHELLSHLQTQARKAEVAERRHVEAAQGKERLTLARGQAVESVEALLKGHKLPRFTRTMLSQAWSDVLALTALRQGKDSQQWQQQMRVAERLVELAQLPRDSQGEDPDLVREIEDGLVRVGYQADDISAIARRLVHPNAPEEDDASSRTELTLRLKSQARLGEDNLQEKTKRTPLNSSEQAELARLQQLPPGHVFEFAQAKGDPVRLRLAWSSQATGALLFVNHRGQKNTDYTMDMVARLLARGQAKIIEEQKGSAIDRAWENVLGALRSFVVPEELGNPPA